MTTVQVRDRNILNDWRLLGGILGIAFVVIFIVSIGIAGDSPMFDDDIDEIREYFADDGDRHLVSSWITGMAFLLLFLPFASALRSLLGAADRSGGMWSRSFFAGALAMTLLGGAAAAARGALAFGEVQDLDDSAIRLAMYADAAGFSAASLGAGLMLVSAAIVILQTRVLWWWLGWLALASAILQVVGALWVVEADDESVLVLLGFIGFAAMGLWIVLVSINMLVDRNREARAAEAAGVRVP